MTEIDITGLDIEQLAELLGKTQAEMASRERKRRKDLRAELERRVTAEGYKMADIFPELEAGSSSGVRRKRPAKYRACLLDTGVNRGHRLLAPALDANDLHTVEPGRPSAWSAAIDSLAVDFDGDGFNPRLLIVSAGNASDPNAWPDYPDSNDTDGVHDPAQAWNALTVGASTELVRITDVGPAVFAERHYEARVPQCPRRRRRRCR